SSSNKTTTTTTTTKKPGRPTGSKTTKADAQKTGPRAKPPVLHSTTSSASLGPKQLQLSAFIQPSSTSKGKEVDRPSNQSHSGQANTIPGNGQYVDLTISQPEHPPIAVSSGSPSLPPRNVQPVSTSGSMVSSPIPAAVTPGAVSQSTSSQSNSSQTASTANIPHTSILGSNSRGHVTRLTVSLPEAEDLDQFGYVDSIEFEIAQQIISSASDTDDEGSEMSNVDPGNVSGPSLHIISDDIEIPTIPSNSSDKHPPSTSHNQPPMISNPTQNENPPPSNPPPVYPLFRSRDTPSNEGSSEDTIWAALTMDKWLKAIKAYLTMSMRKLPPKLLPKVLHDYLDKYCTNNLQTFWLYPPEPSFVFPPRPQLAYLKPVWIWNPENRMPLLFPSTTGKKHVPPCPNCHTSDFVESNGWAEARLGILRDNTCYLLTRRFICHTCSKSPSTSSPTSSPTKKPKQTSTFNGWDERVLAQYPACISRRFEFMLTKRSGVSLSVLEDIMDGPINGKSISAVRETLYQAHRNRHVELELAYYSTVNAMKGLMIDCPVEMFSRFSDPEKYAGFVPSESYLRTLRPLFNFDALPVDETFTIKSKISIQQQITREYYQQRALQHIDGRILSADAAFKVASLTIIRSTVENLNSIGTSRPIKSIYTIFNEYDQIVFQKALPTNSLEDIKLDLKLLFLTRYRQLGLKMPLIFYTDRCCDDKVFIEALCDEIQSEDDLFTQAVARPLPQSTEPLPLLALPNTQIYLNILDQSLAVVCAEIAEDAVAVSPFAVGLDIEWNTQMASGTDTEVPATLQLSTFSGRTVIFQLFKNGSKVTDVPKALQNLFQDERLTFVGRNIKADITRLENHYDWVASSKIRIEDLATSAKVRNYDLAVTTLQSLVRFFLKKHLPKDPTTVFSNWTSNKLSESQLTYAGLDAYAHIMVYCTIVNNSNPRYQPPPKASDISPGDRVLLFTSSNAGFVAEATICAWNQSKFGQYSLQTKSKTRLVVKLDKVLVPGALSMYKYVSQSSSSRKQERLPLSDLDNEKILWDLTHIRHLTPETTAWLEHLKQASLLQDNDQFEVTTPSDDDDFFKAVPNDPKVAEFLNICSSVVESAQTAAIEDNITNQDDGETYRLSDIVDDFYAEELYNVLTSEQPRAASEFHAEPISSKQASNDTADSKSRFLYLLDIFHAMYRICRTILKSHPASKTFMSRLRDAFFHVCKEDIDLLSGMLHSKGWSEEQIETRKKEDWNFFLNFARRAVPQKEELLARFDHLCAVFGDVVDTTSGEKLFRQKTYPAVANLRDHIMKGCLSDVPGIPLYFYSGKSKNGIGRYRCCRGTNKNEGYRKHVQKVLHKYAGSPVLAHQLMIEFNYRWNLNMSVQNRNVSEEVWGFYNQHLLDMVNRLTDGWFAQSIYPDFRSPLEYVDTHERFCLRVSTIATNESGSTPAAALSHSAKGYADLLQAKAPITAITTKDEKVKFKAEMWGYMTVGTGKIDEANYEKWALQWNKYVTQMEEGKHERKFINRTNAAYLRKYFEEDLASAANTKATLAPIRQQDLQLRANLRHLFPEENFPIGTVEKHPVVQLRYATTSQISNSPSQPTPSEPEDLPNPPAPESTLAPSTSTNRELNQQETSGQSVVPNNQLPQANVIPVAGAPVKKRKPTVCQVCGHHLECVFFITSHQNYQKKGTLSCVVAENLYRPAHTAAECKAAKCKKGSKKHFHFPCPCDHCSRESTTE
ncbi:hypothetical protein HDU76_003407, partial [Blyttiomyces sp. JEL0837]